MRGSCDGPMNRSRAEHNRFAGISFRALENVFDVQQRCLTCLRARRAHIIIKPLHIAGNLAAERCNGLTVGAIEDGAGRREFADETARAQGPAEGPSVLRECGTRTGRENENQAPQPDDAHDPLPLADGKQSSQRSERAQVVCYNIATEFYFCGSASLICSSFSCLGVTSDGAPISRSSAR